jgi:type IV secretion system protein VirB1
LAIRDNTTHQTWSPSNLASAVDLARERLKKGHSLDVGLMQINSRNFSLLHLDLTDAFDACRSLNAARQVLLSAYAAGGSETDRQAAILIALSRYNTGRPLAGIANGYAAQVIAQQKLAAPSNMPAAQQAWDVWADNGLQSGAWLVGANESSNFERAGAQSTNARVEARAMPPSAKGEPYELLAYQESKPSSP